MSKLALFLAAMAGAQSVTPFSDPTTFDVRSTPAYMLELKSSLIANAGETTSTSMTETINAEWISPSFQSYASHYRNPTQWFALYEPDNGSPTVSVPRWVSDLGTPADRGDAVDTEFGATEATALSATELETDQSNFSVGEYAIFRELSYTVLEDTVALDTILHVIQDAAEILSTAANDDGTALFAGLSNSSGTTTQDLTLADLDDAIFDLAERGITGELVGVLDHQQVRDWAAAIKAAGTSMAVYAGAVDRIMNANMSPDQGRNPEGKTFSYSNVDFYRSGLTDTANTGADVVGCIMLRGDQTGNRRLAPFGQASRRPFLLESDVDIKKRTVLLVASMRWGCGTTLGGSAQKVVTDAP
jgi:hypothetical protein